METLFFKTPEQVKEFLHAKSFSPVGKIVPMDEGYEHIFMFDHFSRYTNEVARVADLRWCQRKSDKQIPVLIDFIQVSVITTDEYQKITWK